MISFLIISMLASVLVAIVVSLTGGYWSRKVWRVKYTNDKRTGQVDYHAACDYLDICEK